MRKPIIISLILFSNIGMCEKLRFSNNNEEVEITGTAQIDVQTGDVIVETVGTYYITQEIPTPPVILGFYPSAYSVEVGDSINAYWSVSNAESCSASVTQGAASNWSGSKSFANGDNVQNGITLNNLPATLQLSCQNSAQGPLVKSFQVTEVVNTGGGTTNPAIAYFRVNGFNNSTTVTPPGVAEVSWSSTDTTSCTASSSGGVTGWSGSKAVSGTLEVTFSANAQLTLTCNGVVRNFNVTYSNNSNCSTSVYPPNLTLNSFVYQDLNDGYDFGETTHTDVTVNIGNNNFAAISGFGTTNTNFRRRLDFVTPPTIYNKASQSTISISECPGDFSATAVCTKTVQAFQSMRFSTNPSDNPSIYCIIDPTKTYYMNVINSEDPYNVSPHCLNTSHSECAIFYTETSQ